MPLPKKSDQLELNRPAPHQADPEAAQPTASPSRMAWPPLLQLQRTHGNRYVQRLVARLRGDAAPVIQPKLVVGPAGDHYEQEADRVTARVRRATLAEEVTPVQRQSDAADGRAGFQVEPEVEQRITHAGGGQSLPETVRRSLEPRFGADFSGVRVHTDAAADQLNQSLQAQAFTTGQNIFFRRGAYTPGSESGQHLLAHELTHVIQQTGAGQGTETAQRSLMQAKLTVGPAHDVYEQEADRVAEQVMHTSTPAVPILKSGIKSQRKKVIQRNGKDLYKKENLKFLTKEKGRLPTLYFKSGSNSGRLRQQHNKGPKASSEKNKTDYFFKDNDKKKEFATAAELAHQNGDDFQPNLEDYGATLDPQDGAYHCEVTYLDDNKKVAKVHSSGGQIVTDISEYNDDKKISEVYQTITGKLLK